MNSKLKIKDLLSLEIVTLAIFLATVVTTAWIWCYNFGFLSYYGIDIREVDFSVVLSDYIVTIYGLVVAFVVIVMIRTGSFLGDQVGERMPVPSRAIRYILGRRRLRRLLGSIFHPIAKVAIFLAYVIVAILVVHILTNAAYHFGYSDAEGKKTYSEVLAAKEGPIKKLIIRSYNGRVLVKEYDTEKGQFREGYSIEPIENQYRNYNMHGDH